MTLTPDELQELLFGDKDSASRLLTRLIGEKAEGGELPENVSEEEHFEDGREWLKFEVAINRVDDGTPYILVTPDNTYAFGHDDFKALGEAIVEGLRVGESRYGA